MSVGIYDLSPQQLVGMGGRKGGKEGNAMAVTAFEGGGFSRHSCEQGVYPFNHNTVRRINNKGGWEGQGCYYSYHT